MARPGRPGLSVNLPDHVKAYTVTYKERPRTYYYFRLGDPVRLPGLPWSPEFMAAHAAALAAHQAGGSMLGASRTVGGTVNAAVVDYYVRGIVTLGAGSHAGVRSNLERFRGECGALKIRGLKRDHVQAYIGTLKSPAVQRNMLRAIRHFLKWCASAGLISHDVGEGVTRQKMKSTGGFYTWTEDDAAKYAKRHPLGTMARAALELYLNLGVRKSDVVRVGPRYVRDGVLHNFLPQKTSTTNGKRISIKVFESTKAAIDALPVTGADSYLVTSFGKQFTAAGFGNKMRQWCDEAGLPDCSSHGLRKLFMIRLVHLGYSAPAIGALSGHKDLREIQTYIDQYDREKMGIETSTKFEAAMVQKANEALSKTANILDKPSRKVLKSKG